MRRLLRREGFNPRRHIRVSSEHDDYGDRRRVVKDGDPWCTSSGNRFGDWVQVSLGKTLVFSTIRASIGLWTIVGLPSDYNRTGSEFSSHKARILVELVCNYRRIRLDYSVTAARVSYKHGTPTDLTCHYCRIVIDHPRIIIDQTSSGLSSE